MATISSAGVGSGLDVESIISALVSVERKPIEQLETEKKKLDTQLSNFGKLQSYVGTLRDSMRNLTDASTWRSVKGASADEAAVAVTTGADSIPSSYSVMVSKLASAQQNASAAYTGSASIVGGGRMTIELGAWDGAGTGFTAKAGATPVAIDIPENATLAQVRDAINGAAAGVTASIVNDANGARLTLRSSDTGLENGFRVSVDDMDGNANDTAGLSALAYDPSAGNTSMTRNQAASNAEATINGLAISSASNTLGNVIDGLSLKLGKVTAEPVEVTVNTDNDAIKKAVTDFATAYNETIKYLREQTRYDAGSKSAGPLQGDRTAVNLQAQLRAMMGSNGGASAVLRRMSDIGLDPQADGTLKVSTSKLDSAVGQLDELKSLFAHSDPLEPANNGFAVRLRDFTDAVLGTDGALTTRQEGLRSRISANDKSQDRLEERVAIVEKRLRDQYTALDSKMGQLNALSAYVTKQMALLNG